MTILSKLKDYGLSDNVVRRPPFVYTAFRRLLAAADTWDRGQRESWVRERVCRTLRLAQNLPGYENPQLSDELSAWPILKKTDIAGREAAFGQSSFLPSYAAATGGTTGAPLTIRRSARSIAFEQASIDHVCSKADLELGRARVAILRGDYVKSPSDMAPPFWRSIGPSKSLFSSFHLSKRTLPHYVAALRDFKPDVLMCYPSSLQHLLALLEAGGESIRIGYVLASSESMSPELIRDAQRVLDASIIEYYGLAERVVFAYSINGRGFEFVPIYGLPELVPDGDGRFRILGTSLWNNRQVFVRYDTGDFARVRTMDEAGRSDVEFGLRSFQGINGRASERIDLPDGRRIIGLNHIPRGVPGAASVQVYHADSKLVEVFVVPLNNYGSATESAIHKNFYEKFPADVTLRILKIEAPIRNSSGKAPLLVTKI
jgi:phenylacetate-CoA ligase